MQQECKNVGNAIRNVEMEISSRRAPWDAEMEESASHHVIQGFLLRLRRQKRNLIELRASKIHFLMDFYIFQKFEKWRFFVRFWISFEIISDNLVAVGLNWKQILEVGIEMEFSVIGRSILQQINATGIQKRRQRHAKC